MEMTTIIAGVFLLIFALLIFLCFTFMQNQRSQYTASMYKEFKKEYQGRARVAMGFSQTNIFAKPVTLMLAVGDDQRVMDAFSFTFYDI